MSGVPTALVVEDLYKSFGALEVLKGISLNAREHDVISVIGSSGSGKSTLLRCINFLETPDSGRIILGGEETERADRSSATSARSKDCDHSSEWFFKASICGVT